MFEPSAKIAAKIEALAEALQALSPGRRLTYAQLSRVAGEPITGSSYALRKALSLAEKQSGALFDSVRGVGIQRLETKDAPGVGKRANARIRKTASRTGKRLGGLRANDISAEEVRTLAAYRSHFGMIEGLAREQERAHHGRSDRQVAAALRRRNRQAHDGDAEVIPVSSRRPAPLRRASRGSATRRSASQHTATRHNTSHRDASSGVERKD